MTLQASGKVYESRIAKILNGTHIKRLNYGEPAPDVVTDDLIVECKLRKTLHVETWMQQVEKHTEPGKTCAVFAKQKHLDDTRTIVCLRLPDFLKMLEAAKSVDNRQ